jgi:hypothetical protein
MVGINSRRMMLGAIALLVNNYSMGSVRLINGTPVPAGTYTEVVKIVSDGGDCAATVVGPRAILTAAHCAVEGATASFSVNGKQYSAKMSRSPLYPQQDHDVAIGVTNVDIEGAKPATIGGTATVGLGITIFGAGCTASGGGTSDGVMRMGDTVITGFSGFDAVSRKAGGAAVCFGDSGGPAIIVSNNKHLVVGVNSKGNIQDTNYSVRTDITQTTDFLKKYASTNNTTICGINSDCSSQPVPAPTCTMTASPSALKLGETTTLTINSVNATTATIENVAVNVPAGQTSYKPNATGTITLKGAVSGAGGTGACQVAITVTDTPVVTPPSCTLTATPDLVKVGDKVTLQINAQGGATSANIDGTSVDLPAGKLVRTATTIGSVTVKGTVSNQNGSGTCATTYTVSSNPIPDTTPNLAVVPAYCGENSVDTEVRRVCLSLVKKESATSNLAVTDVLLLTYRDLSQEVMPIINRTPVANPGNGDLKVSEDLTLYANTTISQKDYLVLDTRLARLAKLPPGHGRSGEVPSSIEGRTSKGIYFNVIHLSPFSVSLKP